MHLADSSLGCSLADDLHDVHTSPVLGRYSTYVEGLGRSWGDLTTVLSSTTAGSLFSSVGESVMCSVGSPMGSLPSCLWSTTFTTGGLLKSSSRARARRTFCFSERWDILFLSTSLSLPCSSTGVAGGLIHLLKEVEDEEELEGVRVVCKQGCFLNHVAHLQSHFHQSHYHHIQHTGHQRRPNWGKYGYPPWAVPSLFPWPDYWPAAFYMDEPWHSFPMFQQVLCPITSQHSCGTMPFKAILTFVVNIITIVIYNVWVTSGLFVESPSQLFTRLLSNECLTSLVESDKMIGNNANRVRLVLCRGVVITYISSLTFRPNTSWFGEKPYTFDKPFFADTAHGIANSREQLLSAWIFATISPMTPLCFFT